MSGSIEDWRASILTFAAFGQVVFSSLYLTFPWWRSFLGRALFFKAITLTVLMVGLAYSRWAGIDTNRSPFGIFFLLVGIGIWMQNAAFIRIMLTSNREDWER